LLTRQLTGPRLSPRACALSERKKTAGDLAGVTVLVSPAPALSLSSSPSPANIDGGLGGGRPARRWGWRQGDLGAMAAAEAVRPGWAGAMAAEVAVTARGRGRRRLRTR